MCLGRQRGEKSFRARFRGEARGLRLQHAAAKATHVPCLPGGATVQASWSRAENRTRFSSGSPIVAHVESRTDSLRLSLFPLFTRCPPARGPETNVAQTMEQVVREGKTWPFPFDEDPRARHDLTTRGPPTRGAEKKEAMPSLSGWRKGKRNETVTDEKKRKRKKRRKQKKRGPNQRWTGWARILGGGKQKMEKKVGKSPAAGTSLTKCVRLWGSPSWEFVQFCLVEPRCFSC